MHEIGRLGRALGGEALAAGREAGAILVERVLEAVREMGGPRAESGEGVHDSDASVVLSGGQVL